MSFPVYQSFKDSGVEWMGKVPSHWAIVQTKRVFRKRKVVNAGMVCGDRLALTMNGVVPRDLDDLDGLQSSNYEGYQIFEAGDLVFKLIDLQNVKTSRVGMVPSRGIMSPAYIRLEPATPEVARYGFWYFMALYWTQVFNNLGGGVRQTLGPEDLLTVPFPLPSLDEQAAIAAFLDRETAKIDALVGEQRRLIALLKEKRQAVISYAVTKGLNPNAPMKDSGVEWLGEVPAHWSASKIKYETSHVVDCLHTTPTYEGDLLFPAIRTADVMPGRLLLDQARLVSQHVYEERVGRLEPKTGDILYSREGERFGIAALVPENVKLCLGQRMMMFRVRPGVCPKYVMWTLNSEAILRQVDLATGGSTSPHINISDIINFDVPSPPEREQVDISLHIESRAEGLDRAISTAQSVIVLLSERRGALISAAVTGKIDVRGSAKVLPFPVDRARARGLVAVEIIERSAHQATFGRVKLQKISYLAETHAGITELEGAHLREAAGPFDREMIREMEREAGALAGVRVQQPDGPGSVVTYRLGDRRGAHREELAALLGDRAGRFDKLISEIGTLDTKGAEAVATLYAVWNDALIDGETPADTEIKLAVLSEWHPEKAAKFTISDLQIWLDWMRRHGLVPTGAGPRTTTGRLFA